MGGERRGTFNGLNKTLSVRRQYLPAKNALITHTTRHAPEHVHACRLILLVSLSHTHEHTQQGGRTERSAHNHPVAYSETGEQSLSGRPVSVLVSPVATR